MARWGGAGQGSAKAKRLTSVWQCERSALVRRFHRPHPVEQSRRRLPKAEGSGVRGSGRRPSGAARRGHQVGERSRRSRTGCSFGRGPTLLIHRSGISGSGSGAAKWAPVLGGTPPTQLRPCPRCMGPGAVEPFETWGGIGSREDPGEKITSGPASSATCTNVYPSVLVRGMDSRRPVLESRSLT